MEINVKKNMYVCVYVCVCVCVCVSLNHWAVYQKLTHNIVNQYCTSIEVCILQLKKKRYHR